MLKPYTTSAEKTGKKNDNLVHVIMMREISSKQQQYNDLKIQQQTHYKAQGKFTVLEVLGWKVLLK